MKTIISIIVSLSMIGVVSSAEPVHHWQLPIRIVIVNPDGEYTSQDIVNKVREDVQSSLNWWKSLSPISITSEISDTISITSTSDYYDHVVEKTIDMTSQDVITLFVVNNFTTHNCLYNQWVGLTMSERNAIWVTAFPFSLRPIIAHELGHELFGLEDLYVDDLACSGPQDIMCDPTPAYYSKTIGCRSLASIGYPCRDILLPMVLA